MAKDLAQRAEQAVQQRQRGDDDESLQKQLVKMEAQFQRAMPKGGEAVQLIRDVMTCMSNTPKLALCEPKSVLGAAMTCAQLGLRPGVGALGHAWILPFWDSRLEVPGQRGRGGNRAQLIIGYKGYVELGHRSDQIASLHSRVVYSNDVFDIEYGAAEDKWIHKPCLDGPRGEARLFYAVGRLANGGYSLTDPMTVADMEAHRDKFAMAKNREGQVIGPWRDHFDAMAKKTMLLRLMALMPKSTELQRAMDNDGSVRVELSPDAIDTPEHIDGEVIGEAVDTPIEEPTPEREVITVQATPARGRRSAAQDAEPQTGEVLATPEQLAKLDNIRAAEKYDTDEEWFGFISDVAGVQATARNQITADEADRVIALFNEAAAQ